MEAEPSRVAKNLGPVGPSHLKHFWFVDEIRTESGPFLTGWEGVFESEQDAFKAFVAKVVA